MTESELRTLRDKLLHRERMTQAEQGDVFAKALAELPEGEAYADLRENVLHRWRYTDAQVADLVTELLATVEKTSA